MSKEKNLRIKKLLGRLYESWENGYGSRGKDRRGLWMYRVKEVNICVRVFIDEILFRPRLPDLKSRGSISTAGILKEKPSLTFSKATYQAGILYIFNNFLDKVMKNSKPLELLVYNFLEPYNNQDKKCMF